MATKTKKQVIYTETEATVHIKQGEPETLPDGTVLQAHSSKVFLPGSIIALDEVPDYMLDSVKQGKSLGLTLIDEDKAEELNRFAKLARGELSIVDFANERDGSSETVTTESTTE